MRFSNLQHVLPNPSELNMAASIRLSRALSVISKFKYEQILLHPGSRQFLQKIQPSSYVLNNRCLSTSGFRNDQHNSEEIKTESNLIRFLDFTMKFVLYNLI